MVHAPVVLDVHCPGNVVPEALVLHRQFVVALGIAEQKIGQVVAWFTLGTAGSGKRPVKVKRALRGAEQILYFFVDGPASAELELMSSLGQRNIIADLVIVSLVAPRPTGDFEM